MAYEYNEVTGKVTRIPMPSLTKEEFEIMEDTPAPKEFLEKIAGMQLTVEDFCTDVIECNGTLEENTNENINSSTDGSRVLADNGKLPTTNDSGSDKDVLPLMEEWT